MSLLRSKAIGRLVADEARALAMAEVLKAVAHPLRLRLVAALVEGARCVSDLAEAMQSKQAIVSQQLRILRMHQLVRAEPRGGRVIYHLNEPQLRHLVDCMEHCALPSRIVGGVAR